MLPTQQTIIATSLKMYFDHNQTLLWAHQVREIALRSPVVREQRAQLVVFPSFPSLADVARMFNDVPIAVGAQNMAAQDRGAYTGEVSPRSLKQVGCSFVEIGHAERRNLFGESPDQIRDKITLAFEHGLVPLLCVGEKEPMEPARAAAQCINQVKSATAGISSTESFSIVLGYEPEWAIGAEHAAETDYIRAVATHLGSWLAKQPQLAGSSLIYGGSAGPGLLGSLDGAVSGLFLGRFAHAPAALELILSEVPATDAPPDDRIQRAAR